MIDLLVLFFSRYAYWLYTTLLLIKAWEYRKFNKRLRVSFLFYSSQEIIFTRDEERKSYKKAQNILSIAIILLILIHLIAHQLVDGVNVINSGLRSSTVSY